MPVSDLFAPNPQVNPPVAADVDGNDVEAWAGDVEVGAAFEVGRLGRLRLHGRVSAAAGGWLRKRSEIEPGLVDLGAHVTILIFRRGALLEQPPHGQPTERLTHEHYQIFGRSSGEH